MRTFQEAVERLKELDSNETMTAFEMGDIAQEQAPIGEESRHNGTTELLSQLAEAAGLELSTLLIRRMVSDRIAPAIRIAGISYSVYAQIAREADAEARDRLFQAVSRPNPGRSDGRWTIDAVRMMRGTRPDSLIPARYEVEEAKRLLANPAIADAVVKDETVAARMTAAFERDREERAAETERKVRTSPLYPQIKQQDDMAAANDLVHVVGETISKLRAILPRVSKIEGAELVLLLGLLPELDEQLRKVRYLAEHGQSDIDDFVRSLSS